MSSTKTVANKLAQFNKRVVTVEASTIEAPTNVANYLAQFKKQSGSRTDVADEHVIDFFPDSVPCHIYMSAMQSGYYDAIEKVKHAKLTNASFGFYLSSLFYGFYLLNDAYVRPSPSIYASKWKKEEHLVEFMDALLGLPVPEELEIMFEEFLATETERRSHIHVVPSLAGFNYELFYGKIVPPFYYLAIHNTICHVAATSVEEITRKLCTTPLYTITNIKSGTDYVHTPLDTLGGTFIKDSSDCKIAFPDTKWYQCHDTTYNPVLSRSYQRREHLARIPFTAPEFDGLSKIDPYTLIFSDDVQNLSEITAVLQKIGSLIKGVVPYKKTLSGIIAQSSGIGILRHGNSGYMLSMMTHDRSTVTGKVNEITTRTLKKFATNSQFLVAPDFKGMPSHEYSEPFIKDTSNKKITDGSVTIGNLWSSSLWFLQNVVSSTPAPQADKFIVFDPKSHLFPKVYVMDVTATATVDAYKATMFGKVIESYEIDGSSVPLPNTDNALGIENCFFLDSAIPYNLVKKRTHFHDTNQRPFIAQVRARVEEIARHPASSLLVDRTVIITPSYQNKLLDYKSGHLFPGLTRVMNYTWPAASWRFLGFLSNDRDNKDPIEIPNLTDGTGKPDRRLLAWSPYSYTALEPKLVFNSDNQSYAARRSYFIMNWRTILGTDYTLVEVKNAYHSMPTL